MLREGQATDQMVRTDHSVIRVQRLEPASGRPLPGCAWDFPFHPGVFSWHRAAARRDVLTQPYDEIQVVVKDFFAASAPADRPSGGDNDGEVAAPRVVYPPLDLSASEVDAGIPACLVELQVKNEHREVWLRRGSDIDERVFQPIVAAGHRYRVAFDFDRRPLGVDLELLEFDVGMDPGTHQALSYTSRLTIDDPARGIDHQPATITMNAPLQYRGMTFYQHGYREPRDPETGRKTGDKCSVLEVGIDPFWGIKYLGCFTVVLGTVVQFSMRAGVFSFVEQSRPFFSPDEVDEASSDSREC
jgi:hypothetical protein